jgi:hypothetical protein
VRPVATVVAGAGEVVRLGSVVGLIVDAVVAVHLGLARLDSATWMPASSGPGDPAAKAVQAVLGCSAASSRVALPNGVVVPLAAAAAAAAVVVVVVVELAVAAVVAVELAAGPAGLAVAVAGPAVAA